MPFISDSEGLLPDEGYRPISCVNHERLEYAVLRRIRLDVTLAEGGRLADCLPLDVFTRDRAEWLKVLGADDVEQTLRLDAILSFSYRN